LRAVLLVHHKRHAEHIIVTSAGLLFRQLSIEQHIQIDTAFPPQATGPRSEETMNASMKGLLTIAAFSLPTAAFAQSSDTKYCTALVAKYEAYLDKNRRLGEPPQSLAAKVGVEKCKAGDTSGIPAIEKALKDAKFDLPPRT